MTASFFAVGLIFLASLALGIYSIRTGKTFGKYGETILRKDSPTLFYAYAAIWTTLGVAGVIGFVVRLFRV